MGCFADSDFVFAAVGALQARTLRGVEYYRVHANVALPLRWSAPEVVTRLRFTPASDVWSFFMLMFEVWSGGQRPFRDLGPRQVSVRPTCFPCFPCVPRFPRLPRRGSTRNGSRWRGRKLAACAGRNGVPVRGPWRMAAGVSGRSARPSCCAADLQTTAPHRMFVVDAADEAASPWPVD